MATTKSFTDVQQSKKLAEILPMESADMHYVMVDTENEIYSAGLSNYIGILPSLPCWSLSALLDVIPDFPALTQEGVNEWEVCVRDYNNDEYIEITADNPVDACVNMILKLKDLNLL